MRLASIEPLYWPWLVRAVMKEGGRRSDADDIAQAVLMEVNRSLAKFERRGPGAFRGWLAVIVSHQVERHYRKAWWRRVKVGWENGAQVLAQTPDHRAARRRIERDHDPNILIRLIDELRRSGDRGERAYIAFGDVHVWAQPPAAVAERMGVSADVVRRWCSRVMGDLREAADGLIDLQEDTTDPDLLTKLFDRVRRRLKHRRRRQPTVPVIPGIDGLVEIGRGGMGVVYRGRHTAMSRPVAVKVLDPDRMRGREDAELFRAEAMNIGCLNHDHIVQVHDAGLADGLPYLVMELMSGGSLADHPPPSARRAAEIMRAVAGAIQHAHGRWVIHRDLKPSNILLNAKGDPKVADFGLAKRRGASDRAVAPGGSGTVGYMSPQQAAAAEPGAADDIYSIGAVLYHLLSGEPPTHNWGADQDDGGSLAPLVPEVGRDVSPPLVDICLRCLSPDPAARYHSAAAVADDLSRFLDRTPTG